MAINNYAEMQKLVGAVVLRFANIEAMIDAVIRMQYVTDAEKGFAFLVDVLADEQFSFALRCNVLRKILMRNGRTEKQAETDVQILRKVGNARNLLAHIGKIGIMGQKGGLLAPQETGGGHKFCGCGGEVQRLRDRLRQGGGIPPRVDYEALPISARASWRDRGRRRDERPS